jgi:hypothetical protein
MDVARVVPEDESDAAGDAADGPEGGDEDNGAGGDEE